MQIKGKEQGGNRCQTDQMFTYCLHRNKKPPTNLLVSGCLSVWEQQGSNL